MAAPCLLLNLFYNADQDHDHHRYHNGQRHHNDGDDHHHYEGDMANKIKRIYLWRGMETKYDVAHTSTTIDPLMERWWYDDAARRVMMMPTQGIVRNCGLMWLQWAARESSSKVNNVGDTTKIVNQLNSNSKAPKLINVSTALHYSTGTRFDGIPEVGLPDRLGGR